MALSVASRSPTVAVGDAILGLVASNLGDFLAARSTLGVMFGEVRGEPRGEPLGEVGGVFLAEDRGEILGDIVNRFTAVVVEFDAF